MNETFEILYKKKLVDTFKELVNYLEAGNYKWFACGGTCIGALRHKGLIPWDDDIDIVMPRSEYNRFLENYVDTPDYYTVSMEKDSEYPFTFAKFCDGNSTILETYGLNITFGIYIDIFPLDYYDAPIDVVTQYKMRYDKLYRLLERSSNTYYKRHIINMIKGFRVINCKRIFEDLFIHRRRKSKYIKEIKEIEGYSTIEKADLIVSLGGTYKQKEVYKSEWFDDSVMVSFEGFMIRIPKGYDQYLNQVYGDYMKLPPKEKQISKHSHVYDNLTKRLNIKETRNRVIEGFSIEL